MKQRVKKLGLLFMVLILILNMFNGVSKNNNIAHATDIVDINQVGEGTQIHQEGCDLVIKKTQETEWSVPRKPIDLVILQDTSGSFKNTIGGVKAALKTLTTPVKQTEYDPDNPRLVFTDTPETSDRVMVGSFQGLDGSVTYDKWYSEYDYNERVWKQGYRSDTNFKKYESYYAYNPGYKVESTDLIKDSNGIHNFIDNMETEGGTPTVPALEEVLAKYKSAVQNSPEKMKNERKTVFLLITDGVANGVRRPDGKVVIEYSGYRQDQLIKAWGLDSSYYGMEASQNILARAKELTEAGKKLKNELGSNSSVVVGFWEDVNSFKKYGQYGDAYLNGYAGTGVNMNGDTRSVQEIFSSALRDVASPDKVVNGKPATFYVNEQNDINAFADKVLAAVGNALVKENVKGKFKITDGYKVKSVSINGKQIVDNVTDKKTQIKGEVKQNGNDVEISVPDAAFNPGKNKFDYELSRTEEAPETDEEDEVAPDDNYTPGTVERQVGELVGHFSVGDYQTAEIGSKGVKTVKVNELKYCYPNVKKSIKDQDPSNDRGSLEDPILTKRTAYAANLNTVHENFEYTVEYRMNNIPLNMKKNAILVDPLNYRFDFLEAYVTDESGAKRPDFNIRTTKGTDPQTGKENTIVVADIPKTPGTNTETVKEGEYGAHKFKKYTLHVKVKFKDEYPFETNQSNYIKILQENDGLGPLNQAFIKWNGDSNSPTDETASVRRSNNVFVVPPVETNIEKKVRGENQNVTDGKEHYDLPLREDKFIYDIKSGWPGLAKKYVIEDTLKDELEIIKDENNSTKYDVNVLVNNKPVPALQKFVKVEGNKVKLELQEKDITRSLNIRINLANKGNLGPALIHIQIKAKIRDGANLDKYRDQNGVIKIPNISTVILNDNPKDSNIVTVTPDEPTITKKINETLDHLNIPSWEKQANAYNYNIKTALPSNIRDYGTYKVEDVLDQDLELQEGQQPFIKGSAADHFDVSYDSGSRKITAKIKDGHFNQIEGKSVVELVIPAKIKDGVTREKIPNKAKVIYNKANATGEPKELETPPVTVTPPPSKPEITKKVNDKQHVDLQKLDEEFTYKVETTVPHNATNFEITDTIKDVLEFVGDKGNVKAKVDGEDITDVKTEGKILTVKLSEDQVKTKGGKAVVIEFKAKL
ncbi:isopeptide-forming domain-containing fimbrial protein, partial [Gemella morbillorum]|uniref:isopeptide-forming domain-containing fimbrial protein n=1 Tax=Gemella morbillorum TaxID=29391 RepID=UPI00356A1114